VFLPILITNIWGHDVDRAAPERGKRLRSIRKDHVTLYVWREVFLRHSAHLWVIDLCHWERRRPENAAPGPAPELLALASLSASGGSCSGSNPCAGSYIRTAKIIRGIPVVTSILWPLAGALSSSSSTSTPDPDSSDGYPEIGASTYGDRCKSHQDGSHRKITTT
jgi:hypothetical protein